jgi:GntR family transcriptional regulator
MARQGITSSIHNLVFESVSAPPEVRRKLNLPDDDTDDDPQVYLQKKLLLLDALPVAIDVTYILPELGEAFADQLQHHMTFPILQQEGVAIERIEATLECTRANHETSIHLNVPLGDSLLVYRYTAYTRHNRPIVYGETLSRGDRLCYSVVLTT